jgi:hypothetical protein
MITQDTTASAKSQLATVITVTAIIVKASVLGILFIILIVGHANVPITTINISHTSAARGIIDM